MSETAGARFRAALTAESPLQVMGAITAYAGLMAKRTGYKALYLSGGGVAANSRLRTLLEQRLAEQGIELRRPRPGLCTDNGAMIAALGSEVVSAGRIVKESHEPMTEMMMAMDTNAPPQPGAIDSNT